MLAKPKITAIIFDLGGVIMSGGYLPFIHHYCLKCLTPQGKKIIADLEHQVNKGTITERKFYTSIREVFDVHLTPRQMHQMIVKKMEVHKELVRFIPKLKPTKTALFTNSIGHMAVTVLHQRNFPTRKIFNRLFISSKIHLAKPDPQAYRYVITKLKVKPEELLMVDDRRENLASAKKLGMNTLLYTTARRFKQDIKKYDLV
jgi:putative hydrolase of the HAD superfamily